MLQYRCERTFFGLNSQQIANTYEEIFLLTKHGVLSFTEAYNIPTVLRVFFLERLNKYIEDEKEAYENAQNNS